MVANDDLTHLNNMMLIFKMDNPQKKKNWNMMRSEESYINLIVIGPIK